MFETAGLGGGIVGTCCVCTSNGSRGAVSGDGVAGAD